MANEPAFPAVTEEVRSTQRGFGSEVFREKILHPGMSLRDYFAAKALEGMLASGSSNQSKTITCAAAYVWAEEMLTARTVPYTK